MDGKKNILSAEDFRYDGLNRLIELAGSMLPYCGIDDKPNYKDKGYRKIREIFAPCILGNVYFQDSTRTRKSFETAMKRLGGSVDTFNVEGSAMGKGEDKESTLKNMDGYCDLFAIRDEKPYSVRDHAEYLKKPVINAGDGNNEHPTQFVVDAFTMDKELPGGVEGIRLAYVGDLLNGRTVHSSIKGFRMFDVKFLGVAPKGYGLQKELRRSDYQEADMENIFEALSDFKPDVIYWTRVQKNLGSGTDAEYRMKPEDEEKLPKGAIWLHPQPIVGELPKKWERDARALWFRQAHYGVPVRMALIAGILGHADDIEWALK